MRKSIFIFLMFFNISQLSSQVTVNLSNFKVNNQTISSNTINFNGSSSVTLEFDVKLTTTNGNTNNIFGNLHSYITSSNYTNPYQVGFQSIVFTPNYPPFVPEPNFTSEIVSYTVVLYSTSFPSNTGTFYVEYKNNNNSSYKSLIYNISNNGGGNPGGGSGPIPLPDPILVATPLHGIPLLTKKKEYNVQEQSHIYDAEYSWVIEDFSDYTPFAENTPLHDPQSTILTRLEKHINPTNGDYITIINNKKRFRIGVSQPFRYHFVNNYTYSYKNVFISNNITSSSQYIIPSNFGSYSDPETIIGDQARVRRVKIQNNTPEEYDVSDYQWQKRIIRPLPTFEEYPSWIEIYGWKDIPNATGPNYKPSFPRLGKKEAIEYRRLVLDKAVEEIWGSRRSATSNVTRVYPISTSSTITNTICCNQSVYTNTNSSLIIGSEPTTISNYSYQWQLGVSRNNTIYWNDIEGATQKDYMPYNVTGMRNSQTYFYRRFLITEQYNYYLSESVSVTYYPYANINQRGIENEKIIGTEESLNIFPNPTSSTITIEGENDLSSFNVKIIDTNGKILITKQPTLNKTNSLEADLTSLPSGIYTLILEDNATTITRKIIKK